MVKVLCGHFCIACLCPLTRRYMLSKSVSKRELKMILNHVS
ncbi:VOC family protein, partial [Vibrio vulnificus]|nr:VOC family protein [Vibrio vulnificus]